MWMRDLVKDADTPRHVRCPGCNSSDVQISVRAELALLVNGDLRGRVVDRTFVTRITDPFTCRECFYSWEVGHGL